jgi:hypothetical protein
MLKKNWMALFGCICLVLSLRAQENNLTEPPPHINIRFSPLALIEPDMQVMLGAEFRFQPRFSVGLDVGYIFWRYGSAGSSSSLNHENGKPVSGYRIRPEFRYYFKRKTAVSWFGAVEASYKHTVTDQSREVCVSTTGQTFGCDYFQRIDYKEVKSVPGASVKIGFIEYFGSKRKMYFEAFLGLGFKVTSKTRRNYVLPANVRDDLFIEDGYTIFEEGFAPHLPAGIKIGLRL